MTRARTYAACLDSAQADLHFRAANRIHARAHLANLAPERFEQLQREWMEGEQAAYEQTHHTLTPEQKARADAAWEALK